MAGVMSGRQAVLRGLRTSSQAAAGAVKGDMVKATDLVVQHDQTNKEFYIDLNEERAYLQYEEFNASFVDLQHTVVPNSFRGQGVAKILAKEALNHFADNNKKMKLTCWYLHKYNEENPSSKYHEKIIE